MTNSKQSVWERVGPVARAALILVTLFALLILGVTSPFRVAAQEPGSGPFTARLTLGRGMVRSAAWSPRGDIIAIGGALGIWLYTPELEDLGLLQGHTRAVYGLAFSPDGTRLASASHDMMVRVWDVQTQRALLALDGHSDVAVSVAWSPDGSLIASGAHDGTVRLWNPDRGEAVRVLEGCTGWITQVAFSPDGAAVIGGGCDGSLLVWDAASGALRDVLPGTAAAWSRVTGQPEEDFLELHAPRVARARSPQGDRVVTANWDGFVAVSYATGTPIVARQEHTDWIIGLEPFPAPTEDRAFFSLDADHVLRLWDAETGELRDTAPADSLTLPNPSVAPGGDWRAVLDAEGALRVWALPGETLAAEFPQVNGFVWLAGGSWLAVANRNGTITIWGIE